MLVWLATSRPARVRGEVVALDPGGLSPVGAGQARQVRLGPRLYVHLVELRPAGERFPVDALLGYDLEVDTGTGPRRLADLGLTEGPRAITYGGLPLPSFFLRGSLPDLNLLHGSCRLLHGAGEDATVAADELLARTARDLARRPGALFLTGDQIYGDEAAGPLLPHLTRLGAELLGEADLTSVPGVGRLDAIPLYGRQELVAERLGFTSGKAANHLLSFGEYAAMYLVAWDEANWPARFPPAAEAVPGGGRAAARARRWYAADARRLRTARAALPAVRRVLANVPTYMIFDDHDVTDDWNLTREWQEGVRGSPAGRRVVAGALAAYWAFQGWGNAPERFDEALVAAVAAGPAAGGRFDEALWSFDRWSYVAPTDPPAIVLDTRTQRGFDSRERAARLLGARELDRVRALARQAGVAGPGPAILVSPHPVFGLELQERRQKFLVDKVGPYEIDFEAWHSNLQGFCDFMRLLIDDLGLRACVVLSGDVHYGLNVRAAFRHGDATLAVAQLVSSSLKHGGTIARRTLHLLGAAVRSDHRRVGWEVPPPIERPARLADRLRHRPVNTDAWAPDSPVFLAPAVAERVGTSVPPCYEETRSYLIPEGRRASALVGESNVGAVTLRGGEVTHRLLARAAGRTRELTVRLKLAPLRPGGPLSRP